MSSRRQFLAGPARIAVAAAIPSVSGRIAQAAESATPAVSCEQVSLNGAWRFRRDQDPTWKTVSVPHTWQAAAETADYYGVGWYERAFDVRKEWAGAAVRLEFEAVFHSATVWVNDQPAGEHLRKGYTAFALDIAPFLRFGARNTVRVRVDNNFDERMLPRGRSSDWAHDGGIYRPVSICVTPKVFIERLEIDADPDLATGDAALKIRVHIRNTGAAPSEGSIALQVASEETGLTVIDQEAAGRYSLKPGETGVMALTATLKEARLWHFDHPNLYRATLQLTSGHTLSDTFGVRRIEARDGGFYLNGERIRVMGVERMAGSNPEFGMAEPAEWIEHDHADMLNLNCVYTRVHWPQDRRVLDYCDRQGMFIQTEVPTWGPKTFGDMGPEPSDIILQNGLEQLREMIARDRNHPSIFSWGVCNEVDGQNPPAASFAKRLYQEAKRLDPGRLVTYASNSLQKTPGRDISGIMDYVMWNEYYESWYGGTPADLARNLDEIHAAFPTKPIVISEYGYCACTPERPEGDGKRLQVLREHDRVFRERPYVAGLIFFCYNDYRTHIGDKGVGVMKQRVHGVVDVYGARKPSYEALREESSPVDSLDVQGRPEKFALRVKARDAVPAYPMSGYKVRAVAYGFGDIPLERADADLPRLIPGNEATVSVAFRDKAPVRVVFDILRPTGFSAYTLDWKP